MDCLKGYIGMSSKVHPSKSGLYLNQLEGISMASIDGIANGDQEDYRGVFEDVEKRALVRFRTEFISEMNRCFRISRPEIVDCLICENRALLTTPLWYLMGAEYVQEKRNSERINGFTTIGVRNSGDLYGRFMNIFSRELHAAVSGIDIHSSACFGEEEPVPGNVVTFVPGLP